MDWDLLALLRTRRIVFLGGKGGVGKTTIAAALATKAAAIGYKVLLISTDPAHSLADVFAQSVGSEPRLISPNLWALELDPEIEVTAYLARVLHNMRDFVGPEQLPELRRHLSLSRQAPGAQEAALLECLAALLVEGLAQYDLIIVDTAPTGHTLRLMSLPEAMAVWTEGLLQHNARTEKLGQVLAHLTPKHSIESLTGGRDNTAESLGNNGLKLVATLQARQQLFRQLRRSLTDHRQTGFILVLTPERLPILETARSVAILADCDVEVAGVIVNRVMPLCSEATTFWQQRYQQQHQYLHMIHKTLGALPQKTVPLQAQDILGLAALLELGTALTYMEK